MAFKLLGNVIASGTQVQHMAGEIVDIPDSATANSLIRRGLAQSVADTATHVWGESTGTEARGGKSVAQKQQEDAAAAAVNQPITQPSANQPDGFPQKPAQDQPAAPAAPAQTAGTAAPDAQAK